MFNFAHHFKRIADIKKCLFSKQGFYLAVRVQGQNIGNYAACVIV